MLFADGEGNWFGSDITLHIDPTAGQRIPGFIAHSTRFDLTRPWRYRSDFTVMCISIVQASYSPSASGFIFGNIYCLRQVAADF
jgi:hypothetical protein